MLIAGRLFSNVKRFGRAISDSALYITGDKAHENFALLTPHLDLEERFENKDALKANVEARKLNINLDAAETRWLFYLHLLDRRQILAHAKNEIGKEISKLMQDEHGNHDEIGKKKYQSRVLKDEHSVLKHYMYGVEESAAMYSLSLPNYLHPKTPIGSTDVIYTHGSKPEHQSKSHIDIGTEKNYLEYTNNSFVFLIDDAALYEYSLLNYFQNGLLDFNYTQFSNADFCKSIIIEGCGTQYESPQCTITLQDVNNHPISRLHLTGGATYYSFMAYFTRFSVMPTQLPLKFFAPGRKYQPVNNPEPSLLHLNQQSSLEICVASKDNADSDKQFDDVINCVKRLYSSLDVHYRLVLLPADKIEKFESLRLSIQMFSNHLQEYVEVGNVSICDDYLSKRLLFTYQVDKARMFPKIIFGSLLNVQKMLACKIENDANKDLLCELLKQYAPL